MAVEAVIGEPVLRLLFPCSAGKYREILPLEPVRAMQPRISEPPGTMGAKWWPECIALRAELEKAARE